MKTARSYFKLYIDVDGGWKINGIAITHGDWLVVQGKYWYVRGFVRANQEDHNQLFLINPNIPHPTATNKGTVLFTPGLQDSLYRDSGVAHDSESLKEPFHGSISLAVHYQHAKTALPIPEDRERGSNRVRMQDLLETSATWMISETPLSSEIPA